MLASDVMMDSEGDSSPFSLAQSLGDGNGYPTSSTSLSSQYHAWAAAAAAAAAASTSALNSTTNCNNNNTELPGHFSPVSPGGHASMYTDHIGLHTSQATVDVLSVRLAPSEYHGSQGQADGYHGQTEGSRHAAASQSDYHDHVGGGQGERHLAVEVYHHASSSSASSSSSTAQQQGEYGHAGQTSDRLAQAEYHIGQQPDRMVHNDYHSAQQQDRHPQLDYHVGQSDRLTGLGGQEYHNGTQGERMGGQQASGYHAGQASDRGLGQTEYHSGQVGHIYLARSFSFSFLCHLQIVIFFQ